MATVDQIDGDMVVRGGLTVTGTLTLPTATIRNVDIAATAAIAASKIVRHQSVDVQIASSTDAIVDNVKLFHVTNATARLRKLSAVCVTPTTATDRIVTVDLRKNNDSTDASVMSSKPTLTSASGAYVPEEGMFSNTSLVAGDVLYLVTTVAGTSGTQAKGLLVTAVLEEEYV